MTRERLWLPSPLNRHHPLSRGLTSLWLVVPGLDGGKTWYDLAGLNHGTLSGMALAGAGWRGTQPAGGWGSLLFDGVDADFNRVAPAVTLNLGSGDWTLFGWMFSVSATPAAQCVISNDANANTICSLRQGSGKAALQIRDTANAGLLTLGGTTSTVGGWHFLTATRSGSTFRLYVDGKQEDSGSSVAATIDDNNWLIGNRNSGAGSRHAMNGYLDGVGAYRGRALSAAEVKALYDESRMGYPGLLRYAPGMTRTFTAGSAPAAALQRISYILKMLTQRRIK